MATLLEWKRFGVEERDRYHSTLCTTPKQRESEANLLLAKEKSRQENVYSY